MRVLNSILITVNYAKLEAKRHWTGFIDEIVFCNSNALVKGRLKQG